MIKLGFSKRELELKKKNKLKMIYGKGMKKYV